MNHSVKRKSKKMSLAFGIALSAMAFLVLTLLSAVIAARMADPSKAVGPASFIAFLLSGAISGFITSRGCGQNSLKAPMLTALSFVLILFLTGLLMNRGQLRSVTVINLIGYIAIYWVFALLGKRKKQYKRR